MIRESQRLGRPAAFALCLMLCLPLVGSAQQAQEQLDTSQSCGHFGEEMPPNITAFASQEDADRIIRDILDASGLAPNFQIRSGGVPNAAALIRGADRFVIYDPFFIRSVGQETQSRWPAISIMAHEIGHHLNGHTLDSGGSRPATELEADYFSGFVLQRMGATLKDARMAMERLGSAEGSATHPARRDRLVAISNGWIRNCERDPNCDAMATGGPRRDQTTPAVPTPAVTTPTPAPPGESTRLADTCEYARDGECDEPSLCGRGTDTTDCSINDPNICVYARDGECDEPDLCLPGTDTADCSGGSVARGGDTCEYARDGECDEPSLCSRGTDTTDCSINDPNICVYARDGECDEPDLCLPGTDTADCSGGPVAGGDSCQFARDGECDEPGLCNPGTDTTDCARGTAGADSCEYARDGECDEPNLCRQGTDTTDCSRRTAGADSCEYARDGECDEPNLCRRGTDTTDCSRRTAGADSCLFANDGECDEPNLCDPGTDSSDCSLVRRAQGAFDPATVEGATALCVTEGGSCAISARPPGSPCKCMHEIYGRMAGRSR